MPDWKEFLPLVVAFFTAAAGLFSLWWQKRQERLAVTRAILGEVARLVGVIWGHRHWWKKERVPGDIPPLIPFSTDIYDKLADKLGLLDPEIVAQVASFFGFVKFLNQVQKARTDYGAKVAEFEKLYAHSLDVAVEKYNSAFDAALEKHHIRLDRHPAS